MRASFSLRRASARLSWSGQAYVCAFMNNLTAAISFRILASAAAGSAARVTCRPITRWLAPSRRASAGVATRFWSPSPCPLTAPQASPKSRRHPRCSESPAPPAETQPRIHPALHRLTDPSRHQFTQAAFMAHLVRSFSSRLVSTVIARSFIGESPRPSAAARIT